MYKILYAIAAILVVLWIIGFIFQHIISPLVHLLLVLAVAVIAFRFIASKVNKREV